MKPNPWPFPTAESHPDPDKTPPRPPQQTVEVQRVDESTLDHAVEESFPASDPVSVVTTKVVEQKPDAALQPPTGASAKPSTAKLG